MSRSGNHEALNADPDEGLDLERFCQCGHRRKVHTDLGTHPCMAGFGIAGLSRCKCEAFATKTDELIDEYEYCPHCLEVDGNHTEVCMS